MTKRVSCRNSMSGANGKCHNTLILWPSVAFWQWGGAVLEGSAAQKSFVQTKQGLFTQALFSDTYGWFFQVPFWNPIILNLKALRAFRQLFRNGLLVDLHTLVYKRTQLCSSKWAWKKPVLNVYTHNNRLWLPTKEHITQKLLAVVAVKRFVFNLLILVFSIEEGDLKMRGK